MKTGAVHYKFILIFVLLSLGIVTGGGIYLRQYQQHYRAQVERQLSAIAELKMDELEDWRAGHMAAANVFYKNAAFSVLVRRFLGNPADADAQRLLQDWIGRCQTSYQYLRVFLTDTKGVIRLSAPEALPMDVPHLARDAAACLGSGQIAFLDLHRDQPGGPIHMAVMVPIFDEQDAHRRPLGLVALRIDPNEYLYPALRRWPTPSRTAETLLIRRDGNEAVYLNELKFQTNTALNLRVPVTRTELPAVKAALGQKGIVEGIDYRGVPVIADVRHVPDSPWFLVTRMDTAELYTPLKWAQWIIAMVIGVLLLIAGISVVLVWRQQSIRFYRERYETVEAQRESEEKYRRIIETALEGVWFLDSEFRTTEVNDAVVRMLGYRPEELIGKPFIDLLFEEDRPLQLEEFRRRARGESGRYERKIRCKDGSAKWILLSARAVMEAGVLTSTFAMITDITESKRVEEEVRRLLKQGDKDRGALLGILEDERRAEKALRASDDRFRYILENAQEAVWSADPSGQFEYMSPIMADIYGRPLSELMANPAFWIEAVHPEHQATVRASDDVLRRDHRLELEYRIVRPDGTIRWISDRKSLLRDERGELSRMAGIVSDITERKQAEEEIKKQLAELRRWQAVTIDREGRVAELKSEVNELAARLGEKPKYGAGEK